ncbi:MAG: DMT family transporter [Bacteroidota bacterium]
MTPRADEHIRSTGLLACFTIIAFASNSVLCRLALQPNLIDPGSFTLVRLLSGAAVLVALVNIRNSGTWRSPHWLAALALFAYAAPFSFAYVRIPVGIGAIILFPAVQLTMIGWDLLHGKKLHAKEWAGLGLALGGLAILTLPGAAAPDPLGALLMAIAGVSWGAYSIIGRGSRNAVANTTSNFAFASLFAIPLVGFAPSATHWTADGLLLATASGGLASGIGYVTWYAILPRITSTQAGILQLLVPILATLAGIVFLDEPFTTRLAIAAITIISGVALAVVMPTFRGKRT